MLNIDLVIRFFVVNATPAGPISQQEIRDQGNIANNNWKVGQDSGSGITNQIFKIRLNGAVCRNVVTAVANHLPCPLLMIDYTAHPQCIMYLPSFGNSLLLN